MSSTHYNPPAVRQLNYDNNPQNIIGSDVVVEATHLEKSKETEKFEKSLKTVKRHCNRLTEIIKFLKENYNDYYRQGVVALSEEQKRDTDRYHKMDEDLIYDGLNPEFIKAFLGVKKVKAIRRDSEGNDVKIYYSFDHLRMYLDSIKHGAKRAKVALSSHYEMEMKRFTDSMKKENVNAKKKGVVDENAADPIEMPLYKLICKHCIEKGDIFSWAFTVCQWNCMGRMQNVDDLHFNQISLSTDSVVLTFKDSKKDKMGEKVSPKNCYANPFDFSICILTAVGAFLCLRDNSFDSGTKDCVFRNKGELKSHYDN